MGNNRLFIRENIILQYGVFLFSIRQVVLCRLHIVKYPIALNLSDMIQRIVKCSEAVKMKRFAVPRECLGDISKQLLGSSGRNLFTIQLHRSCSEPSPHIASLVSRCRLISNHHIRWRRTSNSENSLSPDFEKMLLICLFSITLGLSKTAAT